VYRSISLSVKARVTIRRDTPEMMPCALMPLRAYRRTGFAAVEMLVTFIMVTFACLGIAGVLAKAQRNASDAFERDTAILYASGMAERIRGNPLQAVRYVAGASPADPAGQGLQIKELVQHDIADCSAVQCSPAALASYDLALWDGLLEGQSRQLISTLPTSNVTNIVSAMGCIVELSNTRASCPSTRVSAVSFSRTMQVSVAWAGGNKASPPAASMCGNGFYGTHNSHRRVVAVDVTVMQPCP